MSTTTLDQLFDPDIVTARGSSQVAELEAFKAAMTDSLTEARSGQTAVIPSPGSTPGLGHRVLVKGLRANPKALAAKFEEIRANVNKAAGADNDLVTSLMSEIGVIEAELRKDWTPTNPVGGTGLTAYDLEGPAKRLIPLHTPLVNSTPRIKGVGSARKFKRIDSVSNAGVPGGAANLSPFFSSLTQTSTWGPTGNLTLARPQKISYTGSDWSIPYMELGFSDSVDWLSFFEAIGYDDLQGLSHMAALYAHKMGEERADLYGRGSASGYAGSVAAPTVTVVGADTGGSLATNTYFVYVAGVTGFGQTAVSTVQSSGARTGPNASVAITVATEPAGVFTYNLYVGTVTGIANAHFQGTFTGNTFTLQTYNAAGAVIAGTDSSADANGYDGYLTVLSDTTKSGYFQRLNAVLSTTNPGTEVDAMLAAMFVANGAEPDELWVTGAIRNEVNQSMRVSAGSGYRTTLVTGDGDVTMGTVVSGHLNGNTGKVAAYRTHRFMPNGVIFARSTSLPLQNTNVAAPSTKVNVQDYMLYDWPDIQMTKDLSTYQIGTLIHQAPAWSGLIVGVK
jgi:hypothetical protein